MRDLSYPEPQRIKMETVEITKNGHIDLNYFILLNLIVLFIVYIVLMNLFLILAILTDPNMRGRLFFKLILLIAVTHFLQGVLVLPLHVELDFIGGKWTHDKDICTFWHLTELTLTVVLAVLFLMLVFERFFSLTYPQIVKNKCLGLLMLLSPWILGTSYVVFLYFGIPANVLQVTVREEQNYSCSFDYDIKGIYSFFGFLCPAAFIFGFSWANVVILCLLRKRYAEAASVDNPRSHTSSASLLALAFITMWFPANSSMIMPPEIYRVIPSTVALYLGFANAALTPSLWLVVPSIKRGFHRLCCCCCTACCGPSRRHQSTYVSSTADESHIRMLGHERVQPSTTTKL